MVVFLVVVFPVNDRCRLGSGHGSRLHVHLVPCSLSDWRGVVSSTGLRVEALLEWGIVEVVGLVNPIPKVSESFEAHTCLFVTVDLDVKSWCVTSLKVSEPVKVDSALNSRYKRSVIIGSGALDEANRVTTAVGEGLGARNLPVVVGSGLDTVGAGAIRPNHLVAD